MMTQSEQCTAIMEFLGDRYTVADYPVLQKQYEKWCQTQPLKGLRVLDATPIFRNTLLKHRNLLAAGAELVLGEGAIISSDTAVLNFARNVLGLEVVKSGETPSGNIDVVLDCAGSFLDLGAQRGYVELTGSGIEKYRQSGQLCYAADSSQIKLQETVLGTGESFFRAMHQLGYSDWSGRKLVVFGSGKVGRGLVRYGIENGCVVTVVSDPGMPIEGVELVDYRDCAAVEAVVAGAYCIVMATGVVGALSKTIDVSILGSGPLPLVSNMGAEDEVGGGVPVGRLIEGGRTVNFILKEPTHLRFIEATMALHNYGCEWVAANFSNLRAGDNSIVVPDSALEAEILADSCVRID